jgi:hypothetical protein
VGTETSYQLEADLLKSTKTVWGEGQIPRTSILLGWEVNKRKGGQFITAYQSAHHNTAVNIYRTRVLDQTLCSTMMLWTSPSEIKKLGT